jgi:hypothetical protein
MRTSPSALPAIPTARKTNTTSRGGYRTRCGRRSSDSKIALEGLDELVEIARVVDAAGYHNQVIVDPSVVRGLEYYTGPVYEVELAARHQGREGPPGAFRLGRRRRAL